MKTRLTIAKLDYNLKCNINVLEMCPNLGHIIYCLEECFIAQYKGPDWKTRRKMKAIAEKRKLAQRGKTYAMRNLQKAWGRADGTESGTNSINTYSVEQIEQATGTVLFQSVKNTPIVNRGIKGYLTEKKEQFKAEEGNKEVFQSQLVAQMCGNNFVSQDYCSAKNNNTIQKHPKDLQLLQHGGNLHIGVSSISTSQKLTASLLAKPVEVPLVYTEGKSAHKIARQSKVNTAIKSVPVDKFFPRQKKHEIFESQRRRTPSKNIRPKMGTTVPISKTIAQKYAERGKAYFKRNAQVNMVRDSPKTVPRLPALLQKVGLGVSGTVRSLGLWLTGIVGGFGLVMIFGVLLLFGAVAASPLGILFSNELTPGSVPLSAAVAQINMELNTRLSNLQNGDYTSIETTGSPPDWVEVIAVFASYTAGAADGMDVAVLDALRVERLRNTFWNMCSISTAVERIEQPTTDETTPTQQPEVILHIRISAKSADEMRTIYDFKDFQNEALDLLLAERSSIASMVGNLSVSQEDAIAVLEALPATLSPERKAVVRQALSLVGKVNYFWGGKSLVIGWDNRWGQLTKVTALGSRTTGTVRPYGLDCSGFVDWVFYNVSGGNYIIGHGGGAGSQHRHCTDISWSEAQPGDLVFYYNDDHIGIVGGWDEAGNILIIHCASGQNNVVITGKSGFVSVACPLFFSE